MKKAAKNISVIFDGTTRLGKTMAVVDLLVQSGQWSCTAQNADVV